MKSGVKLTFYRYLNSDGEHAAVKKLENPESPGGWEESPGAFEESPGGELLKARKHHDSDAQNQPLQLTGAEDGVYTGKIVGGTITLCKDEIHDLLDAERRGLGALFMLELTDK
jgi:hypothetical protein